MPELRIALAQLPVSGPRDLAALDRQIRVTAATSRPDLIVLPELAITPPHHPDGTSRSPQELALGPDEIRELDEVFSQAARTLGAWLLPGTAYERSADGQVFNTARVYSPEGELKASYHKIAPWRPYETCSAGSSFTVVDIPGHGRLGVLICYDSWFPELTRQVTALGADAIAVLTLTATSDREQETVLARAHAITNQVFVLNVNAASPGGVGRSMLVDPEGRVRVAAPSAEQCVLTDVIDLSAARRVRRHGTAGLNRVWEQFRADDAPIELPLYGGHIDPGRWSGVATSGIATSESEQTS